MTTIEIFKTGAHSAELNRACLTQVAKNYNKTQHEAPLCIGHPKHNSPAYGWVDQLKLHGDTLVADCKNIASDFTAAVRAGRFKKRSAAFYHPDSKANPTPGQYYLRHVGFLGAQPPAVKGLADVAFAEDESESDYHFFDFEEKNMTNTTTAVDERRLLDFEQRLKKTEAVLAAQKSEQDQREAAFTERETELNKKAEALEAKTHATACEANATFVEQLITEGKVLPRHKNGLVEFISSLPAGNDTVIEFAENNETKQQTPHQFITAFLSSLPKQVEFAEVSNDTGSNPAINFSELSGSEAIKLYHSDRAAFDQAVSLEGVSK